MNVMYDAVIAKLFSSALLKQQRLFSGVFGLKGISPTSLLEVYILPVCHTHTVLTKCVSQYNLTSFIPVMYSLFI